MKRTLLTLVALVCMVAPVLPQTVALFTLDQPPLFVLDGGDDQNYTGNTLQLGGQPTATGGGGDYIYSWEPADLLDDPSAPNPQLEVLDAETEFTLTVTDLLTGCVKTDVVLVTVDVGSGITDPASIELQIFPNPARNSIRVVGQERIGSITLRSLAGQEVLLAAYPSSREAVLDITALSDGIYFLTITTANGRIISHKLCKAASDF